MVFGYLLQIIYHEISVEGFCHLYSVKAVVLGLFFNLF